MKMDILYSSLIRVETLISISTRNIVKQNDTSLCLIPSPIALLCHFVVTSKYPYPLQ